jgi:hypothetical protein
MSPATRVPRSTFPISGTLPVQSRNAPQNLFRRVIKSPDRPAAHLCRRTQVLASLTRGIQPGDGLIEIHAYPAHQPSGPHQLNQRIP